LALQLLQVVRGLTGNRRIQGRVDAVQINRLLAEAGFALNPVEDIGNVERLRPHVLRIDAGGFQFVDHFLRVLRLAAEDRVDPVLMLRALQLGRVFDAKSLVERDAFLE
jgi:hypothetical protein